jgi:hypothetical protein
MSPVLFRRLVVTSPLSLSLSAHTHSTWAVVGSPSTTTGSIETRGLSAPKNLIIIRANALLWLVHMYICIYVRFWTCILPIECCAVGLFGWRRLSLWSVGGCPSLVSQGQGDIQEEEVPFFFFFLFCSCCWLFGLLAGTSLLADKEMMQLIVKPQK